MSHGCHTRVSPTYNAIKCAVVKFVERFIQAHTMTDSQTTNVRDIKNLRLERHWSQEQLAEMSGLSLRTIQRIENGENASLESLKALASVFETDIADSDKEEELAQARKEQAYVQNVKGFYKLLGLAVFSLVTFLVIAIFNSEAWYFFFYMLIFYAVTLAIYSINSFDFFGKDWEKKIIAKKFRK